MKGRKIGILFLTMLLLATSMISSAQNRKIDSLLSVLEKQLPDTARLSALNAVSRELINVGVYGKAQSFSNEVIKTSNKLLSSKKFDYPDSLLLSKKAAAYLNIGILTKEKGDFTGSLDNLFKALKLFERIKDPFGISKSLGNIGIAYRNQGDYRSALKYYAQALEMDIANNNEKGIARGYSNIGLVYTNQGDHSNALSNFYNALKVAEKLKDSLMIGTIYGNIGLVYKEQKDLGKALENYKLALNIDRKIGNRVGIARHLTSLGLMCDDGGKHKEAQTYFNEALAISEEVGNKNGIISQLGNLGLSYVGLSEQQGTTAKQKDSLLNLALKFDGRALKMAEEAGDKRGEAINLGNIGDIHIIKGNYKVAQHYLGRALVIDTTIGLRTHLQNTSRILSGLFEKTGDYQKAGIYYRLYSNTTDSIFTEEKNKEITRSEMTYEFEKKETALKAEQDIKDAILQSDKKRQNILFLLIGVIAISLACIAVVVFRSLRTARKQTLIIEHQKAIVEEKQQAILDSIYYARRIQRSLLPTEKYIARSLNRLKK